MSKTTDRDVCIKRRLFRAVKMPHTSCLVCDIFQESHITAPHQYPLCYTHNMKGQETDSQWGLVVNWCKRHPGYIWKRIPRNGRSQLPNKEMNQ